MAFFVSPTPPLPVPTGQFDLASLARYDGDLYRVLRKYLAEVAFRVNALLPKDGSEVMTGPLNMGGFAITNVSNIVFPATEVLSTDPNTLDAYEEGTWTGVVVGTTAAGVGTYTQQATRYTRVGRLCQIEFNIGWSAHTGTGFLRVDGLPFASGANPLAALSVSANGLTFTGQLVSRVQTNSTQVDFQGIASGAVPTGVAMDTSVASLLAGGVYTIG